MKSCVFNWQRIISLRLQFLYNFCTTLKKILFKKKKSNTEYVGPTCRKTYQIVSLKKKIEVVQKLCQEL
jgi:uncharacterized pyridoxamine 5'-phosphate oxidase family protein